jgi:hypothetical protein
MQVEIDDIVNPEVITRNDVIQWMAEHELDPLVENIELSIGNVEFEFEGVDPAGNTHYSYIGEDLSIKLKFWEDTNKDPRVSVDFDYHDFGRNGV